MSIIKVLRESGLFLQPSQPLPRIINFREGGIGVFPISFHQPEGRSGVAGPETWGRGECHRISEDS